ncbi:MAG: class II fructose-bisphosphate aldolase [Ruthenibacterium lactatiformans]
MEEAIRLGFSSVMYDCSMLPFEENVRRTREMTAKAHAAGCSLEAEIGHVGSNGSAEEAVAKTIYTQPQDALRCCRKRLRRAGCCHWYGPRRIRGKPVLNLDCLASIAGACSTPLVLHGGSGLSDDDFRACVAGGISKINIFTHNNLTAARAAHTHFTESVGAFELMPFITGPSSTKRCIICAYSAATERRKRWAAHRYRHTKPSAAVSRCWTWAPPP